VDVRTPSEGKFQENFRKTFRKPSENSLKILGKFEDRKFEDQIFHGVFLRKRPFGFCGKFAENFSGQFSENVPQIFREFSKRFRKIFRKLFSNYFPKNFGKFSGDFCF